MEITKQVRLPPFSRLLGRTVGGPDFGVETGQEIQPIRGHVIPTRHLVLALLDEVLVATRRGAGLHSTRIANVRETIGLETIGAALRRGGRTDVGAGIEGAAREGRSECKEHTELTHVISFLGKHKLLFWSTLLPTP